MFQHEIIILDVSIHILLHIPFGTKHRDLSTIAKNRHYFYTIISIFHRTIRVMVLFILKQSTFFITFQNVFLHLFWWSFCFDAIHTFIVLHNYYQSSLKQEQSLNYQRIKYYFVVDYNEKYVQIETLDFYSINYVYEDKKLRLNENGRNVFNEWFTLHILIF